MCPMGEIHLAGLLVLSVIIACGFAHSFAVVSRIKPIIAKLWQEESFKEIGPESDPSIIDTDQRTPIVEPSIIDTRRITLTLSIDKETDKVLFAESNKDFIEVIFSFLTLPMGEIVRLSRKTSGIPPLDNLYASVEALDEQSFQTAASKNMLLHPRSAYRYSSGLAIELYQKEPSLYYICSRKDCRDRHGFRLVSLVKGSECICKGSMAKEICVTAIIADKKEGFLEDQGKFIISDDLVVLPATVSNTQKLISRETKSSPNTEVRDVTIGTKEVLQILKYSMMSTRPLTNALLSDKGMLGASSVINREVGPYIALPKLEYLSRRNTYLKGQQCVPIKKIKANVLMERSTRNIIGLEARADLVDLMFSFLTIPLGSVVKLCNKKGSSLGCTCNLHWSVEHLQYGHFKSERSKNLLLSPKIAPKYGCKSQLLKIEEETEPRFDPRNRYMYLCYACFRKKKCCTHGSSESIAIINPKIPGQITGGGGFLKQKGTLIITNDLRVEYLRPALHARQVNSLDVHIIGIDLDEGKASEILFYLMTSANVLNNALHDVALLSHDGMTAYSLDIW